MVDHTFDAWRRLVLGTSYEWRVIRRKDRIALGSLTPTKCPRLL
jgi:hypothetical protein